MEELQAKHRREQTDLRARITQKKKSATKKTRKGVNDECVTLERDLKEKQDREIAEFTGIILDKEQGVDLEQIDQKSDAEPKEPEPVDGAASDIASSQRDATDGSTQPAPQRKPNRQKARLARRAAEQETLAAQAAEEAASLPDLREQERKRMEAEFEKRGLREREIRPDGHCLYAAIADQMEHLGIDLRPVTGSASADFAESMAPYRRVRTVAAGYIADHADDFVPFLEEPLEEYLEKVRNTGEWGGQLELLALAKAYGININVLQGDGRVEKIEGGKEVDKETYLAYYKHGFGLGEHYNSLRKAP